MAALQTVLTNWKNSTNTVSITLRNGQVVEGVVTDDGTVGDSILVTQKGNNVVLIPKSSIDVLPNL